MHTGKILLAEDDRDLAEIIKTSLELQGYKVHHVADADLVMPSVYSFNPRLAILDVMMPSRQGLDGIELVREIRANHALEHLKLIVMSAIAPDAKVGEEQMREELGVSDYLAKPFEIDDFLLRVARVLPPPEPASSRTEA